LTKEIFRLKPSELFDIKKRLSEDIAFFEAEIAEHYGGNYARALLECVLCEIDDESTLEVEIMDYLIGKVVEQIAMGPMDQNDYRELLRALKVKKDHPFVTALQMSNADKRFLAEHAQQKQFFHEFRVRVESILRSSLTPIHKRHAEEDLSSNISDRRDSERSKAIKEASGRMQSALDDIDEEIFKKIVEIYSQKIIQHIEGNGLMIRSKH
jgi:hypothetical protein